MRVHVITNLFAPDELAGAALFTDLARFLKERGHDVRITCTFSYYPAWKIKDEDRGIVLREESYKEIPVRRVAMYVPKQPTGKGRMLSDLSFLFALLRRGRFRDWEPDAVLTALPMLSQCLAQRFLYRGRKIPRLIVVQDFVVEAALELGILRLPGCARLLHGIQRWALRSAQTLSTISPGMLGKLRAIVGPDRRVCYTPNWIHGSLRDEIDRQSHELHLRGAKMLFYAGNLGVKQGLPDFISQFRAAAAANTGWKLKIHGGGAERDRIAAEINDSPEFSLGRVLNESDYVTAIKTASACLITQRPGVGANFLPSKLLPALATGTPVLAVCERNSPLGQEVIAGEFGEVVEPGDSTRLAETLNRWSDLPQLRRSMEAKAREHAQNFQRDRILALYEKELLALGELKPEWVARAGDRSSRSRSRAPWREAGPPYLNGSEAAESTQKPL